MKKEELEKLLEEAEDAKFGMMNEKNVLECKLEDAQAEVDRYKRNLSAMEGRFEEERRSRIFVEGQLNVLKRMSRLYPEEEMTRDEYKERTREILSSVELPF